MAHSASDEGSKTFIRIAACGQTRAHRPQSMQIDGSQNGSSSPIERFSHLAVSVGKVPSMGMAETGSRSPLPPIMIPVTRCTKSGADDKRSVRDGIAGLPTSETVSRDHYLPETIESAVDGGEVSPNHDLSSFAVALGDLFFDRLDGFVERDDLGEGEEANLEDGVDASSEPCFLRHGGSVNHPQVYPLLDDPGTKARRQVTPNLVGRVRGVDEQL